MAAFSSSISFSPCPLASQQFKTLESTTVVLALSSSRKTTQRPGEGPSRDLLWKKRALISPVRCDKKEWRFDPSAVEPPPYHVYLDSTSGQLEPTLGARASIPGKEYWPEGTANRVRAANAPAPVGKSEGKPSHGRNPGSRRKGYHNVQAAAASESSDVASEESSVPVISEEETLEDTPEDARDRSEEYVIYQQEEKEDENLSSYGRNKTSGRPHPFVDPSAKPVEESLSSEELWWNWRKSDEYWSRWQRRRPDVDTVFAKAMAETGQIKLYGDHPTIAEATLARARKEVLKEERLEAERRRLEEIGPIAYYSEWVKAWKRDTSREAVQRHFEETGEDENTQLIAMFQYQTAEEYRIMMGTDVRIKRDPLAMRMREDQIKEIWGGDPVYPTVNYIRDPNEVVDYRGPDFHEPLPSTLPYYFEHCRMVTKEELDELLAKENSEGLEATDLEDDMEKAVDIGENDDGEGNDIDKEEVEDETGGNIYKNWSVLKTNPQMRSPKRKSEKKGPMSLEEAIEDSENMTDFFMDFGDEE